ncbi:glycosyltransferase family 4 protein [Oxynema sp. CENA135]|uniref:glycosyltransferase family 4 protein n=1 Tax=Oxynema sp. CENA135 TaxID=984206 RepID=UPI00190E4336|nr:glycosyltransferase family 4 protein [Oxynema sp. CENA135]MBK4730571.1 glycosyltransferase family 4 protein [Oxynema sp. CENA135]
MKFKRIVATGEPGFLYRRQYLFQALSPHFERFDTLPCGEFYSLELLDRIANFLFKVAYRFSVSQADRWFQKNPRAYRIKSRNAERKIRQLQPPPDLVFHVFGLFAPFWDSFEIPYTLYLDYTMALAAQNWPQWAPFSTPEALAAWMACERQTYRRAYRIFAISQRVKSSLIEDYGIEGDRIIVVGSAPNFNEPYELEKPLGSQQILFNASDFERKGGDLVLAAFPQVKKALPNATLTIVGRQLNLSLSEGVSNPGRIGSREAMRDLFVRSDLVLSPSYCDPFPIFVMEAMSHGVPCIVSNRDGMPEIVNDRDNGRVLPIQDPELLAEYIIEVLGNLKQLKRYSQAAKQTIKTRLNWPTIADKMLLSLSETP